MPPARSLHKKPELLSPAGSVEAFFAAVENGADAVYFGLDCFSARANAHNFTLDDASMAIAYARTKSIKVYIALNTLIKAAELEKVAEYLIALEELQPDALIIQDMGVLRLIQSRRLPFHVHASTQMAIHNLAGVKQLERMGFKRVVLARELSLPEIRHITQNTPLEIEVFVHGALCYSYSGLCFFSSMSGGRSGNRGQCSQPCRMCYTPQSGKEGYLFSMKDLLALPHIDALMDAGVRSFKIEGRMKSPEYVAVATHVYRQAIDGKLEDYEDAARLLKSVFSRETTHSYLKGGAALQDHKTATGSHRKPVDVVNLAYPANTGCCVGEIVRSLRGFVTVRADAEIGVRDLLQVFEDGFASPALLPVRNVKVNGKKVFGIKAGETAIIESQRQFQPGSRLYLLYSQKTRELFAPKVPKKREYMKLPVSMAIAVSRNIIEILGVVREFPFTVRYPVHLEKGISRTIDATSLQACFSRLGETPFELLDIRANIADGLFIPLGQLNEIRRDYFQKISEAWKLERMRRVEDVKKWIKEEVSTSATATPANHHSRECQVQAVSPVCYTGSDTASEDRDFVRGLKLSVKIDTLEYMSHLPLERLDRIYLALTPATSARIAENQDAIVDVLREKKDQCILSLPVILRDYGCGLETYMVIKKMVQRLMGEGFRQFQVSNPGAVELLENSGAQLYADYPLYCLNPLSANALINRGFCRYTLSPEDDKGNMRSLLGRHAEVIVYQDTPFFLSDTCVWAQVKGNCPGWSQCAFKHLFVKNEHGDRFMVINEACKTLVIGEKPYSIIHRIPELMRLGQVNFRLDLCYRDYSPEVVSHLLRNIQSATKVENSTMGNFERGLL